MQTILGHIGYTFLLCLWYVFVIWDPHRVKCILSKICIDNACSMFNGLTKHIYKTLSHFSKNNRGYFIQYFCRCIYMVWHTCSSLIGLFLYYVCFDVTSSYSLHLSWVYIYISDRHIDYVNLSDSFFYISPFSSIIYIVIVLFCVSWVWHFHILARELFGNVEKIFFFSYFSFTRFVINRNNCFNPLAMSKTTVYDWRSDRGDKITIQGMIEDLIVVIKSQSK